MLSLCRATTSQVMVASAIQMATTGLQVSPCYPHAISFCCVSTKQRFLQTTSANAIAMLELPTHQTVTGLATMLCGLQHVIALCGVTGGSDILLNCEYAQL